MKQKELISKIEALETSIKVLKERLVNAKVLQGVHIYHDTLPWENHERPISLIDLKKEIEGIKEFLNIEFVEKPSIPAKNYMKKLPVVGASKRS
jgi:hypothetical protein